MLYTQLYSDVEWQRLIIYSVFLTLAVTGFEPSTQTYTSNLNTKHLLLPISYKRLFSAFVSSKIKYLWILELFFCPKKWHLTNTVCWLFFIVHWSIDACAYEAAGAVVVMLWTDLVVHECVESLPVALDLGGDVLVLEDHTSRSALPPLCRKRTSRVAVWLWRVAFWRNGSYAKYLTVTYRLMSIVCLWRSRCATCEVTLTLCNVLGCSLNFSRMSCCHLLEYFCCSDAN